MGSFALGQLSGTLVVLLFVKWIKRIAITLGVLYLLILGLLYFKQEALLFHPFARAADYQYGDAPESWVALPDGERLNALHLRRGGEGVILYLHGNRGDNGRSLYQTKGLHDFGYDLFLVDYRGFGKSSGTLAGEADLTEDLQVVYDQLKREYAEDRIIVMGYSLGTGPASFLAANNDPQAVVLVAPYTSLAAMKDAIFPFVPDFLVRYPMDNLARLSRSNAPVHILHGQNDELIPVAMGRALSAIDPGRISLTELPDTGHRGAILHRMVSAVVGQLVQVGAAPPPIISRFFTLPNHIVYENFHQGSPAGPVLPPPAKLPRKPARV